MFIFFLNDVGPTCILLFRLSLTLSNAVCVLISRVPKKAKRINLNPSWADPLISKKLFRLQQQPEGKPPRKNTIIRNLNNLCPVLCMSVKENITTYSLNECDQRQTIITMRQRWVRVSVSDCHCDCQVSLDLSPASALPQAREG